jgi:hypothetical protein
MKSRLFVTCVVTALIAGSAFAGTTLAGNGNGHGQRHGTSQAALFAVLTGRSEISPTTGHKGAGDPDGLGSANVLIPSGNTVCFGISVTGLATPSAAHIHRGKRNQNGPIVVTLTAPSAGNPGASSGCVNGVSSSLVSEIRKHPSRFYVNVHTSEFPGGAIRGQL